MTHTYILTKVTSDTTATTTSTTTTTTPPPPTTTTTTITYINFYHSCCNYHDIYYFEQVGLRLSIVIIVHQYGMKHL